MVRHVILTSAAALLMATPLAAQQYRSDGQRQDNYPAPNPSYQQPYGYQQNQGQDRNRDGVPDGQWQNRDARQGYGQDRNRDGVPDRQQSRESQRERELNLDIETALRQHGYDVGEVDGRMDSKSRAAIRAYERDANLPNSGQPSRELLAHIEKHDVRPGSSGTSGRREPGRRYREFPGPAALNGSTDARYSPAR